jgi:hypothetical protein
MPDDLRTAQYTADGFAVAFALACMTFCFVNTGFAIGLGIAAIAMFVAAQTLHKLQYISFSFPKLITSRENPRNMRLTLIISTIIVLAAGAFISLAINFLISTDRGPDVAMRLVIPTKPAIMLDNKSAYTARMVKYVLAFIYLTGTNAGTPVPVLVATADFIKGHDSVGPENLFDPPQILRSPSEAQKMFGWIQISCPDCVRIRYYWTYIKFGFGGWYAEVSKERFEDIVKWLRNSGRHDGSDSDINEILSVIPMTDRIQIQAP